MQIDPETGEIEARRCVTTGLSVTPMSSMPRRWTTFRSTLPISLSGRHKRLRNASCPHQVRLSTMISQARSGRPATDIHLNNITMMISYRNVIESSLNYYGVVLSELASNWACRSVGINLSTEFGSEDYAKEELRGWS